MLDEEDQKLAWFIAFLGLVLLVFAEILAGKSMVLFIIGLIIGIPLAAIELYRWYQEVKYWEHYDPFGDEDDNEH